jgi:hypothetical protein
MKKIVTFIIALLFSTGLFAQEHTVSYQVIVQNPCDGSNITIDGGSIQTGQNFTLPASTLPSSMSSWQQLYDALVGTTFGFDSGCLDENITIGINIFNFNCQDPGYYFDPNLFMFIGITVIGENSGMHGLDDFYYFQPGTYARLTIPLSADFNQLLQILNLTLNDVGFGYYIADVFYSNGLSFTINADNIELDLSHFSKFGGGRGSLVGVENQGNIPNEFSLSQNYPNPFNPTTHIRYSLQEDGFVTLKIYNALGSEIQTLVSGNVNAGVHEVNFDGSKLSSGIYFYELRQNNKVITKKMILMK